MDIKIFTEEVFAQNNTLKKMVDKHTSGQVTIIGGSRLFHGAAVLALKGASRMVSMTYFASPENDKDFVNDVKNGLSSFVWVPRDDIDSYVEKSDAVLIGPGLMRSHIKEQGFVCDKEGMITRDLTISLFKKFPNKKWIVDGGSLQVISVEEIPEGSVITPNLKEFEMLFKQKLESDIESRVSQIFKLAEKYRITILSKDEISIASDGKLVYKIYGGNDGLVKGGVGDVIAGVSLGFFALNDGLFSVAAASYLVKKAAEKLALRADLMFNADDLSNEVPAAYKDVIKSLRFPQK